MTLAAVAEGERSLLGVHDRYLSYSISEYIRLKYSCVKCLCFVIVNTYISLRTCMFFVQG